MSLESFSSAEFSAQNIGGLTSVKTTIKPGLNIIEEPNAFGKTSLLRAFSLLVTPSGNHKDLDHMLRINSNEGKVLIINEAGSTLQKTIIKSRNTVTVSGDDAIKPELADLVKKYAIGGSDNEILTAIRNGDNLKELLTNDFNTDLMKQRIRTSEEKVDRIGSELKVLKEQATKLPAFLAKKEKIEADIEKLEKKKISFEKEVQKFSQTEVGEKTSRDIIELTTKLRETDAKISAARRLIDEDQRSIEELKADIEKTNRIAQIKKGSDKARISAVSSEMESLSMHLKPLRKNYDSITLLMDGFRKVIDNIKNTESEDILNGASILDSLNEKDKMRRVSCPCCGRETEIAVLEKQLEEIKKQADLIKKDITASSQKIEMLEKEKRKLLQEEADRSALAKKGWELEQSIYQKMDLITTRQNALNTLFDTKNTIQTKLKNLSSSVNKQQHEVSSRLEDVNQEIGNLKAVLKDLVNSIDHIKSVSHKMEKAETDYQAALQEMNRNKSDLQNKEYRLLKLFNEAIENVYSRLNFNKNVWRITLTPSYDIQVMRAVEGSQPLVDGLSVKTLSKSELEVVGLIIMLSGYMINDIQKVFPFIILDELTFLDNERLKDLMDFMSMYTTSIILTKLPSENNIIGETQIKIKTV